MRGDGMRRVSFTLILLALLGSALACGRNAPPDTASEEMSPWFTEISGTVGLKFVHEAGPPPAKSYFLPQILGSGAALFDYDNDGRLDIYLIQNGGAGSSASNRLFHQEKDGSFTDV